MPTSNLTSREKQIAAFLGDGLTAKQISKRLKLSFHTVEGYQRALKKKLNSKTPCQLGYLWKSFEISEINKFEPGEIRMKEDNNVTILDLEQGKREVEPLALRNAGYFTSLTGIACQVVLFFYFSIQKRTDQSTGPLSLAYLAKTLEVRKNTLKNTIMRLQKKQYVVRECGKSGRGGFINFKLANPLYQELNRQEALGMLKQTVINKESNTYFSLLPKPLPEAWRTIDYSVLMEVGFTASHLQQLYEMKTLDALSVQNSIYHFAFDLKHNNKKAKIRGDVLDYFMGILLKRTYNASSNYVHPDIEAWQEYEQTTRQLQSQREEWETKAQALEFKNWYEQLSDEEIKNLTLEIPEAPSPNIRQRLLMRALKQYFIEVVWPLRCREILRSYSTWAKTG